MVATKNVVPDDKKTVTTLGASDYVVPGMTRRWDASKLNTLGDVALHRAIDLVSHGRRLLL